MQRSSFRKEQKILLTTLPNGVEGGKLRLSVHVSPRLWTNEPQRVLGLFNDFLDWPARVRGCQWDVHFEGGPTLRATRVSAAPDSDLWGALFTASTRVQPYAPEQLNTRYIFSYPVRNILRFIKGQYQQVATQWPIEFPSVAYLTDQKTGLGHLEALASTNHQSQRPHVLKLIPSGTKAVPSSPDPKPDEDFKQFKFFHEPRNAFNQQTRRIARVDLPRPEDFQNLLDFHRLISILGQYPNLQRRLGLVIDLQVSIPPQGIPTAGRVWVTSSPVLTGTIPPKTKYQYLRDSNRFTAAPRPLVPLSVPFIVNGFLALGDDHLFDVVQVDVDGAAIKAMGLVANLFNALAPAHRMNDTPERASLPTLRSAGLAVAWTGRALELANVFARGGDKNVDLMSDPPKDIKLFAEDLVRGYRIDIWDNKTGQWHSLCQRRGIYHFVNINQTLPPIEDEGWVATGVTSAADGSTDDLFLSEMLFRWAGWSLCAPRPGKTITSPTRQRPTEEVVEVSNAPPPGLGLRVSFSAVSGSLPRLRFGTQYRLRARAVDLAGNGLTLQEADALMTTPIAGQVVTDLDPRKPPHTYARFEPISAPALLLCQIPKEGESVERLVIRSFNDDLSKDHTPTTEISQRHIAPPKTSQLMAETHGMFEIAFGANAPQEARTGAYNMAKREEGTFLDTKIVDTATGEKTIRVDGVRIVNLDPEAPYAIHEEPQLRLPYLPDPIARGAAFRRLPGVTTGTIAPGVQVVPLPGTDPSESVLKVSFDGAWPELMPFRVELAEGAGAPLWDASQRILRIQLSKAEVAKFRLSSFLGREDLQLMGQWLWIQENNPQNLINLRASALAGQHWMLTPFHEITLVHAVQQPLIAPRFQRLTAHRELGDTFAWLVDVPMPISGKSTIKVDTLAEWNEPIDDPNNPQGPQTISGKAHAFEIPLKPDDQYVLFQSPQPSALNFPRRHEFGDTKYRRVRYKAIATTRFREYFPAEIADDPKKITRESDWFPVDVKNSARPAAPKVLYAIPTFGWETKHTRGTDGRIEGIESNRSGSGLRVYMERPWYSSGDGELLGVILIHNRYLRDLPDNLKPYITQWGVDPIYSSDSTYPSLSLENFKGTAKTERGLTLEELKEAKPPLDKVDVAGYEVSYDKDRRLWYCDIEIDAGLAYYPFVRLALARYQPNSIRDAHLSRVVLADFAQLAPDREVRITFGHDSTSLTIEVIGLSTYGKAGHNEMNVSLEERDPKIAGDLSWIPVESRPISLVPTSFSDEGPGWSGTVILPAPRDSKTFRLVIREYEVFFTDPEGERKQRRLVYAHVVNLIEEAKP
jgi:hypothetical protein